MRLLSFLEEFLKQKSKTSFLTQRDAYTKYYHAHASTRRSKNQMREFISFSQEPITCHILIAKEIVDESRQHFIFQPELLFL